MASKKFFILSHPLDLSVHELLRLHKGKLDRMLGKSNGPEVAQTSGPRLEMRLGRPAHHLFIANTRYVHSFTAPSVEWTCLDRIQPKYDLQIWKLETAMVMRQKRQGNYKGRTPGSKNRVKRPTLDRVKQLRLNEEHEQVLHRLETYAVLRRMRLQDCLMQAMEEFMEARSERRNRACVKRSERDQRLLEFMDERKTYGGRVDMDNGKQGHGQRQA